MSMRDLRAVREIGDGMPGGKTDQNLSEQYRVARWA